MRFVLIDRIVALQPRERIVAKKAVSLAEEYLADHFPTFPVLPGVLMVEAMVQTAAWLVRDALDFAPSLVLLQEARNVTYKSFAAPGQVLTLEARCRVLEPGRSEFDARGLVDDREIVKGRLSLRHMNLSELGMASEDVDARLRAHQRTLFGLLWRQRAGAPGVAALDC